MKNSTSIITENLNPHRSKLINAIQSINLEDYSTPPDGVWGCKAIIQCGNVSVKSTDLDLEFDIPFDDNLEADEGEIIIYNLSDKSISELTVGSTISIKAGYNNDLGTIFIGTIQKVSTKREGADRATTIKVSDDIIKKTVNKSYDEGATAQQILEDLLREAAGQDGYKFEPVHNYEYENSVTLDGELETEIKKYADVCGVSVFKVLNTIYAININSEGTNISGEVFELNEDTGLIGSPEPFEETVAAEDYEDTYNGIDAEMFLKHNVVVTMQVKVKSEQYNGTYAIKSGSHSFDGTAGTTKIKAVQKFNSVKIEKDEG